MQRLLPHTFEYVYNLFKEQGCELLSKEYKNNHILLDYRCSCGNESQITLINFQSGHRCKKCMKKNPKRKSWDKSMKSFEFVKGFFNYMGCTLLSTKFENNTDKLKFICLCGKEDKITFASFKRGLKCKECSGNKSSKNQPYIIEFIDYYLSSLGLKLLSNEYKNNRTQLKYVCTCGNVAYSDLAHIMMDKRCDQCAIERRSGENNHLYDEGQTPLFIHLRDKLGQWKKDSMKDCNYKCVITGDSFDVIHHLYGFNMILKETMSILNLDYYDEIDKYNEETLKKIEDKCVELHYTYGLGVCLSEPIHKLFHSKDLYGIGDNTPEQFEEFKIRFKSGEFNGLLTENNLTLNL